MSDLLFEAKEEGTRATMTPLSVYVLWHPNFKTGALLAEEIYRWLGGDPSDARRVGLGIPVHFRSEDWNSDLASTRQSEESPAGAAVGRLSDPLQALERAERLRSARHRRPIARDHATHNVFVPLVDDHMVNDPSWRRDLLELARAHHECTEMTCEQGCHGHVHLAPIQLSRALAQLPIEFSRIKALYLDRWSDPDKEVEAARRRRLRVRLRRLLTQGLVRLLREHYGSKSTLPTAVFLSHAKMDLELGPGAAERLRDVAAGYGQIEVFYDENDLPMGRGWESRMLDAARNGAGFVAVLSDHYATRYWCRREVEIARTPCQLDRGSRIWSVRPTVAAVTLQSQWSRLIGDLASVPTIAWREERAVEILDRLFREALLAEMQTLYARELWKRVKDVPRDKARFEFLTWMPDATTMMRLYREAKLKGRIPRFVVYPGHGFLPTEEEELKRYFHDNIHFVSYEALADAVGDGLLEKLRSTSGESRDSDFGEWPMIALSTGDASDLGALGYDAPTIGSRDSLHLDSAVLRIGRALLQARIRIAYGGYLRRSGSFTSVLTDTVASMFPRGATQEPCPNPDTPFESFLPWPFGAYTSVEKRASLAALVRHHDILPPGFRSAPGSELPAPRRIWLGGCALSAMRQVMARKTEATIALAGREYGFSGFLPGVAEELLIATEWQMSRRLKRVPSLEELERIAAEDIRVALIGGFGGVVRQMVRFVLRATEEIPASCTLDGQLAHRDTQKLKQAMIGAPNERARNAGIRERYLRLAAFLRGLRSFAQTAEASATLPELGLSVEEWIDLMRTDSPGRMRRLIGGKLASCLHS